MPCFFSWYGSSIWLLQVFLDCLWPSLAKLGWIWSAFWGNSLQWLYSYCSWQPYCSIRSLSCVVAGVSAFARALLQGQLVAISTRSSLATVPALLQGARCHLPLPESVLGFMIPFSASSFKLNRTISSLVRLLFVTHIFGITIEATQLMTFVVTVLLLSFSSAGVPTALGATTTLPAYLAAGAPIEGVIFLATAELIPDIFKTLLNTTGYLTVTVVLARWGGLGDNEGAPTIEASLL